MRHLTRCGEFGQQPGASALLHLMGKLVHCLLGDVAAFTPVYGRAGVTKREEKCGAFPLAFFPQGKRLLHGVLFGVKPSAVDRAAGESLLVRGKLYVHAFSEYGNRGHEAT